MRPSTASCPAICAIGAFGVEGHVGSEVPTEGTTIAEVRDEGENRLASAIEGHENTPLLNGIVQQLPKVATYDEQA